MRQTKQYFHEQEQYERYGQGLPPPRLPKARLAIHVSAGARPRALLIMDVLLKALEACGHKVEVPPSEHDWIPTQAVISGQRIWFSLDEDKEGGLSLRTDWSGRGCCQTWRDGKRQRLEHLLPSFGAALLRLAMHRQQDKP